MANQLQENLDKILTNKNTNLLTSNLKQGVTCLGIEGSLEEVNNQDLEITENGTYNAGDGYTGLGTVIVNVDSGSSSENVKLFETIDDMNNSTGNIEGDLALVYKDNRISVTSSAKFSVFYCPKTITLDEVITDNIYCSFESTDSSFSTSISIDIGDTYAYINVLMNTDSYSEVLIDIVYISDDGITYTRTDENNDIITLDTTVKYDKMSTWYDTFGLFIYSVDYDFQGIYKFTDKEWVLADIPLTAIAENVYDSTFYGVNGVETGTLTVDTTSPLDGINAKVYLALQDYYNNLSITVTDDNHLTVFGQPDTLIFPSTISVDTISCTEMSKLFYGCSNLTELILNNFDTSNVTNMNSMFSYCTKLTSLDLSNFNTSNVTNFGSMFYCCSNLTELDLSNFDTSSATNISFMFYECNKLTNVDISNFDTSNVTSMSHMFARCDGLDSLNLDIFNTSNVTSMARMFESCNGLANISLSNWETSNVTSFGGMFYNCTSLTELDLSSFTGTTNTTETKEEGTVDAKSVYLMFDNCSALKTLDISGLDWRYTVRYAFRDCTSLKTVYVKDSISKTACDTALSNAGLSITSTIKS